MTTPLYDRLNDPRWRFEFGDSWLISNWDGHELQTAFQKQNQNEGAVDFVGVRHKLCWMIEVTDYRRHAAALLRHWEGEELDEDIAHKVMGTDKGLRWCATLTSEDKLVAIAQCYAQQPGKTPFVLWLEHGGRKSKAELSVRAADIKSKLRGVNVRVLLTNRAIEESEGTILPDVVPNSLPDRDPMEAA